MNIKKGTPIAFGIATEILRNKELSTIAKTLYVQIDSISDNFQFNKSIFYNWNSDSKWIIDKGLKELQNKGYLFINKYHNDKGRFCYDWVLRNEHEKRLFKYNKDKPEISPEEVLENYWKRIKEGYTDENLYRKTN